MKLSFWNWVHLATPYFLAIFAYKYIGEGSFLSNLGFSLLITTIITSIPHMDGEVKTGRSFKTKYGKIDEYKTVRGELSGDIKAKIGLLHLGVFLVILIYGIYSSFQSS
ncbi:MAG: hypothetical protein ACI7YS_18385 [Flavobacterium sp.]